MVQWVGGGTTAKMSAKVANVPFSLCFGPKVNYVTVDLVYKLLWYIPPLNHISVAKKSFLASRASRISFSTMALSSLSVISWASLWLKCRDASIALCR